MLLELHRIFTTSRVLYVCACRICVFVREMERERLIVKSSGDAGLIKIDE